MQAGLALGRCKGLALVAEVVDRRHVEDERLGKILDAVGEIVVERGVSGVTTALVARRARVAPGKFYELFSDKYAVLEAATERNVRRYLERIRSALEENPVADLVELGLVGLEVWIQLCRENPGFLALRFWRGPQDQEGDDGDSRIVAVWAGELSRRYGIADTPALRRQMSLAAKFMVEPVEYAFTLDPQGHPDVLDDARKVLRFYLGSIS